VILYFAANWPKLGAGVKAGLVFTAVLAAYGSGYYLQYVKGTYPRIGHALIFLGALFYGAGIWLIAQIFHLSGDAGGYLLWGLGALPVAWLVRSRPVLYLSGVTLTLWTIIAQQMNRDWNLLYPVLMVALIVPLARKLKDGLAEAGTLLGLFAWIGINLGLISLRGDAAMLLVAQAAVLFGAATFLEGLAGRSPAAPYTGVGAALSLFGLYLLTFDFHANAIPSIFGVGTAAVATGALLLGAALLAGFAYWRQGAKERLGLVSALGLLALLTLASPWLGTTSRLIGFNLLLFGMEVGLIAYGIARRSGLLVNLSLVAFVIHLITRYFDLFFQALDKSLFFVLGGLLLIGGGLLLERNRRRWMEDWGGDDRAA
jgi:uncharacterized membrane protein